MAIHDVEDSSAKRPQDVMQGGGVHHRSPSISSDRGDSGALDMPVRHSLISVSKTSVTGSEIAWHCVNGFPQVSGYNPSQL